MILNIVKVPVLTKQSGIWHPCPNNLRFSIGSVCRKCKNVLRFHERLKAFKTKDEDLSIRILEQYEILGKSL